MDPQESPFRYYRGHIRDPPTRGSHINVSQVPDGLLPTPPGSRDSESQQRNSRGMFMRLEGSSEAEAAPPTNRGVWFDISADGRALGRIVIRLFDNTVPYTTHNFRCFTNGYRGVSYVGTSFFQIDPYGLMGGDFQQNDGGGGWSVYGTTFKDESLDRIHDRPGLLTMANMGKKDTNGSQFIITSAPRPELDRRNVVFGEVSPQSLPIIYHICGNTVQIMGRLVRMLP